MSRLRMVGVWIATLVLCTGLAVVPLGTLARTKPMGVDRPAFNAGPLYARTACPGVDVLKSEKPAPLTPLTVSSAGS